MKKRLTTLGIGLLIVAYIVSMEVRLYWAHNVNAQNLWRIQTIDDRVFDLYRELDKPLP